MSWGLYNSLIRFTGGSAVEQPPAAKEEPNSRRAFLRRSTMITVAGGAAAFFGSSLKNAARADFPDESRLSYFFRSIQGHENDHVAALLDALGDDARPEPTFHNLVQDSMEAFIATSQVLENVGVGAYLGALPAINDRAYVAAAGSIALVEARHAGFLNGLQNAPLTSPAFAPGTNPSFDDAYNFRDVVAAAAPFIRSLNGGRDLSYDRHRSDENDVDILNYALALEYLEAEYYNLNVRRFFM